MWPKDGKYFYHTSIKLKLKFKKGKWVNKYDKTAGDSNKAA